MVSVEVSGGDGVILGVVGDVSLVTAISVIRFQGSQLGALGRCPADGGRSRLGELAREVSKSQGSWGPLKRLLLSLQVSGWWLEGLEPDRGQEGAL